jgi:hypothetical protein
MDDSPTCGKGLAEHAALPAKLGALTDAMAVVLETHMKALDVSDDAARREHEAYKRLAKEQHSIAAQLKATAMKMAACRSLPMGRHDERLMIGKEAVSAFKTFVGLEQELFAMLEQRLDEDRAMLALMSGARRD